MRKPSWILAGILLLCEWTGSGPATAAFGKTLPENLYLDTTDTLPLGYLSRPYTAKLTATGGKSPYTWSIKSGKLPAGLSLASSTGQISGAPTSGGTYSFTIAAADSSGQKVSKTLSVQVFEQPLDLYGGLINKPCTEGKKPHFYTEKMGNRWYLCTPAGNAFWENGVADASPANGAKDYQGIVQSTLMASKYATGSTTNYALNWSLQTARRLQSWGFNTVSTFAYTALLPSFASTNWATSDHTIPVKLAYSALARPTFYSFTNTDNYGTGYVKDLMNGISTSVYPTYRWKCADYWDPNFNNYLSGALSMDKYGIVPAYSGPHNDYLIGIVIDQADELGGFGAGPDFPTISNGLVVNGYAAHTQPHLGWLALVTAPTQTSNTKLDVTYTDTTVYTKKEFSTWLAARYRNSISALNTAWGSKYTTFGSNGGFGVGTGLLDEDGLCPAKTTTCWVPKDYYKLTGATSAMQADLNAFLLFHAQHYFSVIKSALNEVAPGILYLGPASLGSYGTPPRAQVLQAAGQYSDVLSFDSSAPPDCQNCTDKQQRVDFSAENGGDKPWMSWDLYPANADAYTSPWALSSDWFKTQAARGQYYQNTMMPQTFNACDTPTGTCHNVGEGFWALYDNCVEHENWGLATPRDDPYDGVSSVTTQAYDAWGYPAGCLTGYGCEVKGYGDFLSYVRAANLWALRSLVSAP